MATSRQRNDFIGFILDAEKDEDLTVEFLKKKTATELYDFFQKKKYLCIPFNDCKEILMARKGMAGKMLPPRGKKPPVGCPAGAKVY